MPLNFEIGGMGGKAYNLLYFNYMISYQLGGSPTLKRELQRIEYDICPRPGREVENSHSIKNRHTKVSSTTCTNLIQIGAGRYLTVWVWLFRA